MTDTSPIVVERDIAAPLSAVWRAISDGTEMPKWFFTEIPEFRPELGFETQFTVHADGDDYVHLWRVTEAINEQRLSYTFNYEGFDGDALVTWELSAEGEGTRVTLTHHGVHTFPRDRAVFEREAGVGGWNYFLDRLKAHLETDA